MFEGRGESYELGQLPAAVPPARPALSQLVMPERYHRALDAFLQGRGGSQDSDSDSDSDDGSMHREIFTDKLPAGARVPRRDSLESLIREKKAREGNEIRSREDDDLEAQPAWMHSSHTSQNNVLRRRLALPIILIILLVFLAAFFAGRGKLESSSTASRYHGSKKKLSLEESLFGTYWAETKSIDWLGEAGDGVYSYKLSDNSIMLHDLASNTTRRLVEGNKIMNDYGIQLDYATFRVSPDLRYILFSADRDQVWRWSSRSNFWIHDLEHSTTVPLIPRTHPASTAIAKWAPKGHSIAYVQSNDLYISTVTSSPDRNNTNIRITSNGNETIFNGIPDWVYEEEVFSSDSAAWWSPDGKKLAFLSFDESEVQIYSYPVYNPGEAQPGAKPYPTSVDMRYPKPGTPNPKVTLHLFDLAAYEAGFPVDAATYSLQVEDPLDVHDRIVTEVAWVGDNDLIIKETNRAASRERVAHFDFSKIAEDGLQEGLITRDIDYDKLDGGWAPAGQRIHGMRSQSEDSEQNGNLPEGYLDVIPDAEGYMHLALFSPANAKEPVFLSTGTWEIDGAIKGVDLKRRLAYFVAANPSIERHVYSVPLPTIEQLEQYKSGKIQPPAAKNMTDTSVSGFYDVSFSPQAGYYLLGQKHGIPWQKVNNVDDPDFNFPISDNAALRTKLAQYSIPKTTFSTIQVNDTSINVAVTLPVGMDMTGRHKYPVLLRPYGGPNSQTVQNKYKIDWTHYLASQGYIVLEIDGRGTGFKGRNFRSCIRGNLGELEAMDQIAVAQWYSDNHPFVDPERIGIQGWSYGGYLAAKVIETNSTTISLGMSVAPVTDWRYYDTIYTERYMDTLEANKAGYSKSAIHNMEGFRHADYLLLHGSGDDNVHFLNSAALLDRLTSAKVQGFSFRMFTDSAHSMAVRGAYAEVFAEMTRFLQEKFGRNDKSIYDVVDLEM